VTLRQRATAGVFWVGLSAAVNSLFVMLIRYVLVRMLLPAEFGLVAMAGLAIDLLQMFREMGFASALIYRKGDARKAADTMFITVILIAVVLFAIAFLSAPLVAAFFRAPALTAVLRVLAVNILISAFGEVQFSLLAKNLAFRQRLLPDLVPTVAYGVVAIGLALMNLGVWSLVIAKIVDSTLTTLLAWIVVPWWRPKLRFDRQEARELLDYGKHIVGSSVLIYFITNLDNTFVGRVLGQEQLGFYGTAYTQANLPAKQISSVIGQVLFPAYSEIQDDKAFMRRAFFRTLHYVALLVTPLAVAMIVFASPFINMVYGVTWAPTILPLQVLAVYGLLRGLAVNMGSVFRAAGKPHWLTYIAVWRLAVMGILLYPATRYYGIVGVSVLSSVVSIADFIISATLTSTLIHGKLTDYVRVLWLSCVVSLLSAAVGLWSYQRMSGTHDFIALVTAGSVMMGIYALFVLIIDAEVRRFIQGLLLDAGQARKRLGSSSE
jgi:O-antigen/teichoic acid export membrane protein